jgi:putative transposase
MLTFDVVFDVDVRRTENRVPTRNQELRTRNCRVPYPSRATFAKGWGSCESSIVERLDPEYSLCVPWSLKRFQHTGELHFVTFSCYRRQPLLGTPAARRTFERELERARRWYGYFITGYVVMPEHVHLLISEPERGSLSVALQMLKQTVSKKLRTGDTERFWQRRYYDFNVYTPEKRTEKLKYMHRNPVKRGLVACPEEWEWSSFRHYATGMVGEVEIESHWTARRREQMGMVPVAKFVKQPHPFAKYAREG